MNSVLRSGLDRTLARRRRRPETGIGCRLHQNSATDSRTGGPVITYAVLGPVAVARPVVWMTGPSGQDRSCSAVKCLVLMLTRQQLVCDNQDRVKDDIARYYCNPDTLQKSFGVMSRSLCGFESLALEIRDEQQMCITIVENLRKDASR